MKFLQFIRALFFTRTDQIRKGLRSNSKHENLPGISKTIALLDLNLLSENWYGTPSFTENYQLDISDGYPDDFVPFELSKNKLNPNDNVLWNN